MNFFINCQTVQEIKSLFRELAFKYHPDHGGDEETMKRLNNEYQSASFTLVYMMNSGNN
jgi:DnaJ-class molecular chaperone